MSKIKRFFITIVLVTSLFSISSALAQTTSSSTPTPSANSSTSASTPTPSTSSSTPSQSIDVSINNPLGVSTINDAVAKIMGVIMKLAIPIIICFFIWTGFQFILAQGDPKKLKDAKTMLGNVIVGSLLVLGAWTIAIAIVNTVNLITG